MQIRGKKQISIFLIVIMVFSVVGGSNIAYAENSHTHTSNCYIGHNHQASGCNFIPTHYHTGDANSGGGCFGQPIYHKHTNICTSYGVGGKHQAYKIMILKETDSYMSDSGRWYGRAAHITICCPTYSKSYTVMNMTFGVYDGDYSRAILYNCNSEGSVIKKVTSTQYTMGKEDMSTGDPTLYDKCKNFYHILLSAVYDVTYDNQYRREGLIDNSVVEAALVSSGLAEYGVPLACFYCNNAPKEEIYGCGKLNTTIEKYELNCGKTECNEHWSCGKTEDTNPICNEIITSIRPKSRIKTYFGEELKNMKAIATYLDGHTAEVDVGCNYKSTTAKVDVDEIYTLTYSGRVNSASYGVGKVSCPVTIWTAPLIGITAKNKKQVIYEGEKIESALTAHYKDMPDKVITESDKIETTLDSSKLGEQEVTVTYKEANSQSDTIQIRVAPKPSKIKVDKAEVDKNNIPKYSITVKYTDESEDNYEVPGNTGLKTEKEYRVGNTTIEIPIHFEIELANKNEEETGIDHKTGGVYKVTVRYNESSYHQTGISELKVYDTCLKNEKHKKFTHDVCPVCKYIETQQTQLDDYKTANEALQQDIRDTLEELGKNKNFVDSDFSNRYQENVKENQFVYDKSKEDLEELLEELEKSHDQFDNDFNMSEDIETVDNLISDITNELDKKQEEYSKTKENAKDSYNNLVELNDKTNTMKKTIPEIIINNDSFNKDTGKFIYEYCENEITFDVHAKGCKFDKEEINTKLSVFDDGNFRPLKKGDLINVGKYQVQITTESDDYKEGSLVVELEVMPKLIKYTAKTVPKVYDGTTNCVIKYTDIVNKVRKDEVGITNPQGIFENKNVGSNIGVSTEVEVKLTGKDAHNYIIEQPTLVGTILPKNLEVSVKPMTIFYGSPVPKSVDYVYEGFVEGESEKNVKNFTYPNFKMPTVYEAIEYKVKVSDGEVGTNYSLVYKDGVLNVAAPQGSKRVPIVTVVSSGSIHVHANMNGKKQDIVLNSKDNLVNVYHETGHVDEYTYIVDKNKYTFRVTDEGVFPILDVSYDNIVISGDKNQGVIINQGDGSYKVPYDKIIITGQTDSNTVTTNDFIGTIFIEDLEITSNEKNPVDITNESKVDMILNGNSTLHTNENHVGIRVDGSSSITISGDGSIHIPNSGIGGNLDEASGDITINGGEIDCEYIGDGKDFVGDLHNHIIIDGGIVNVNEIRPQATSSNEAVKAVQVSIPKSLLKKQIFYQRGENFYGTKIRDNNTITIIVYEKDKRVEVLIDSKKYYIIVNGNKGTLHSYGSSSSSSNSIWDGKAEAEKKEEQKKDEKERSKVLRLAQSAVIDGSDIINYNKNDKIYYINQKVLKAKKGYVLSQNGKIWKKKISSGKQKVYTDYDWYSYNKNKKEMNVIVLSKAVVDYKKPIIKFKKVMPNTQEISKPSIEYGISGRKTSYYKLVPKGKKTSKTTWKLLSKRTVIPVIKKGKYTLYIKAIDKASNSTIQKKTFRL